MSNDYIPGILRNIAKRMIEDRPAEGRHLLSAAERHEALLAENSVLREWKKLSGIALSVYADRSNWTERDNEYGSYWEFDWDGDLQDAPWGLAESVSSQLSPKEKP